MTETTTQETTHYTMLPKSWEWARVQQLGSVVTGSTPSTKHREYYDGSIPFFKPTDLNAGYRVFESETTLTKEGAEKARILPAKSILVTCIGATIGKTGLSQVEGATNQQINALVPSKGHVVAEYLYFVFISCLLQDQILSNASSTTMPILNKSKFSQLNIPLPPLNEQRRIVGKIEELFTKLDAGARSLEQAQILLKHYRQSLLTAAVEGELSRKWREAYGKWPRRSAQSIEHENARTEAEGSDSARSSELWRLPNGWAWVRLGQLADVTGGLTKNRKRSTYPLDLPYLRVANVYANELRLDDVSRIGVTESELDRVILEEGDLLVVEGNGSQDQIGRVALWDGSISPCVHQNHLIKVRLDRVEVGPYVLYWLLSTSGRTFIRRVASSTSGLYTLSISKVKDLPIPLPPFEEQREIVAEIERRLSIIDQLDKEVEDSLRRVEHLRRSILAQAVSGKLVSQDHHDEPSHVLLTRLKEDTAKQRRSERERKKHSGGRLRDHQDTLFAKSLFEVLAAAQRRLTPEDLLRNSGHSEDTIDAFYAELRREVESSHIRELREHNGVFLEAIPNETR